MHVGRSYRLIDFALWSRRSVIYMIVVSLIAIGVYHIPGIAGFGVPWPVVLVLGTTVSLVAGFKNAQVLSRAGEALQLFAQIAATSRIWAGLCRDFADGDTARILIHRHLAWLTALRFSLRRPMPWETVAHSANAEFRKRYHIVEDASPLRSEIAPLLGADAEAVLQARYPALQVLDLQMRHINQLSKDSALPSQIYGELLKSMRELHDQQSRADRIKNYPYPRQYAIVGTMFVTIFCTMLPFGAVPMFAELSDILGPYAVWLSIPFSTLLGWMYLSLDQVGESTSNPFEGNANDVPISQICRDLEIELRTTLGEQNLPAPLAPTNGFAT
nr:bestrophin family ion channel [uncultured Devosia sp.]